MRRNRKDNNHNQIVNALEKIGVSVLDLSNNGGGAPDLCLGYRGVTKLLEIKNKEFSYGKKGLAKKQSKFAESWNGSKIGTATTVDEAIKFVMEK